MPSPLLASEITIGTSQFPTQLHPLTSTNLAKNFVLGFMTRPLTTLDPQGTPVRLAAESMPRDHMITLKKGLTWGDGVPVTTQDILFTWEAGRDPASSFVQAQFFQNILELTPLDDRRFLIKQKDPQDLHEFFILPAHLEKPIFSQDPAHYHEKSLYIQDPTNKGLYFGPYLLKAFDPGASAVLTPNPFWPGKINIDEITLHGIENPTALEAALLSHELDLAVGLSLEKVMQIEQVHQSEFTYYYEPYTALDLILINFDHPDLKDIRVRQALLYALDREHINKALYKGRQEVANNYLTPKDHAYIPHHFGYDPGKARALLKDYGRPVSLELLSIASDPHRAHLADVLVQSWKDIGVEVHVRTEPARTFFGSSLKHRTFTSLALIGWPLTPNYVHEGCFLTSAIPSPQNHFTGQNFGGYASPKLDTILNQKNMKRFQNYFMTELPMLPLFYKTRALVASPDLKDLTPTRHLYPMSFWAEQWSKEAL